MMNAASARGTRSAKPAMVVLLAVLGGSAYAQEAPKRAEALARLMPAAADLEGFQEATAPELFARDRLADLIDGEAESFYPYGVSNTITATLQRGTTKVQATVFDMTSPLGAYGVFSTHRPPEPEDAGVGTAGFIADGALAFFRGDYYVDLTVMGRRPDGREVLGIVAKEIAGRIQAEDRLPEELRLFPEAGKVKDSDQFIPRGHLGIEQVPRAFVVKYEREGVKLRASLSPFETSEQAQAVHTGLVTYIEQNAQNLGRQEIDGREVVFGVLKYRGMLAAALVGTKVLTVCGGESPDPALRLLAELAASVTADTREGPKEGAG